MADLTNIDGGILATAAGGLAAAVLAVRKLGTRFAMEGAETSRAKAEMEIVDSLRKELSRLAGQNELLANMVNQLQVTIVELNAQVVALRSENAQLRSESEQLRTEVARLNAELNRMTALRG